VGIVKRQSIKFSIVSYGAILVATLATIFIYDNAEKAYGAARFLIDTSLFLSLFIWAGTGPMTVKFYPEFYKEGKGDRGLLRFALQIIAISGLIFILVFFLFKGNIEAYARSKDPLYEQVVPLIIPMSILVALMYLFTSYASNFKRIVIPSIFQNLIKLSLPVFILLIILGKFTYGQLFYGILITYSIIVILFICYIWQQGQLTLIPKEKFITKSKTKSLLTFAGFNLFAGMSGFMALKIDSIMIPNILSEDIFTNNGVYGIAAFIGAAIGIPYTSIVNISGPLVSDSIKKNNFEHVEELYKKGSTNLLLVGLALFSLVTLSIGDLFNFMDASTLLKDSMIVVVLIGIAKLVDMGSSLNNQIINYSDKYKVYILFLGIMAVSNVVLNVILIKKYGISGAAMATCFSMIIFNLAKLIYIQFQFKIHPFSKSTIFLLAIASISFLCVYFLPIENIQFQNWSFKINALVSIGIKSILFIAIYGSLILWIKPSSDFHQLLIDLWSGLKKGKLNLK
jgi:O-antigen/teichoic acid export membrane protein